MDMAEDDKEETAKEETAEERRKRRIRERSRLFWSYVGVALAVRPPP